MSWFRAFWCRLPSHVRARRGLRDVYEVGQDENRVGEELTGTDDELVAAATFLFPDEAEAARGLLRSCDILCYLENEHTLAKVWQWNILLGGLRLMVPASLLEQTQELLSTPPAEED